MSTTFTKNPGVASSLGPFLRQRREATIDPNTGRTYTRGGLGQAVGLTEKAIEAIENGRTKSVAPEVAGRFSRVLGITVSEICEAMGYRIESMGLTDAERELIALYRRVPEAAQDSFLAGNRAVARGAIEMYERLASLPKASG